MIFVSLVIPVVPKCFLNISNRGLHLIVYVMMVGFTIGLTVTIQHYYNKHNPWFFVCIISIIAAMNYDNEQPL